MKYLSYEGLQYLAGQIKEYIESKVFKRDFESTSSEAKSASGDGVTYFTSDTNQIIKDGVAYGGSITTTDSGTASDQVAIKSVIEESEQFYPVTHVDAVVELADKHRAISAALNKLHEEDITIKESITTAVEQINTTIDGVVLQVEDLTERVQHNELVTAVALTDLNDRCLDLDARQQTTDSNLATLNVTVENHSKVVTASLNDLNQRIIDLEDDQIDVDLSEYATVSQLSEYLPLTGGTMSGDITMSGETKLVFGDTSVYNNGHLFIDGALQVESQVTANGFSHATCTSDDYVLLAGGGAKLLSEIKPDMSGYLPLTGGTMSGDTKFNGASIYFDEDCAALRMNDAGALEIYSEDGITLSGFVECSGSITCASSINAQAFYETSDARKKDIKEDLSLDKCYDLIDKCQTVIYSLKDQTKEQVGMIAQEIEEFFPEVVATDEEGFKSLAYDRLVVICFKVLKDVIKRLEKLENNGSN